MQAILNKLWGKNKRTTDVKQSLTRKKVKLSKVDDLKEEYSEQLRMLQTAMNPVLDGISRAKDGLYEIQEVLDAAYIVDTNVGVLIEEIESLGVDVPADLQELKDKTDEFAENGDIQMEVETHLQEAEDVISDIYQKYF